MDEHDRLAEQFRVRSAGTLRAAGLPDAGLDRSEADDAVQEAWLRLSRTDISDVANLDGLAAHGRVPALPRHAACPHSRAARSRSAWHAPRRGPGRRSGGRGRADRLGRPRAARGAGPARPAERVAFVLHDLFAVPFDQIAPDRRPHPGRDEEARQPGPAAGPGRPGGPARRTGPAAAGRRGLPRRRPQR